MTLLVLSAASAVALLVFLGLPLGLAVARIRRRGCTGSVRLVDRGHAPLYEVTGCR